MGFFKRIFRPKQAAADNEARDEAIDRGLETKRNRAEIRRLNHQAQVLEEQREIARLKAEIADEFEDDEPEESSADQLITNLILSSILKGKTPSNALTSVLQSPQSSLGSPPIPHESLSLADEEIVNQIKKIPKKYVKLGKSFDDNTLRAFMQKNFNYDNDTVERAIKIFRA